MATWVTLDGASTFPFTEATKPIIDPLKASIETVRDTTDALVGLLGPLIPLLGPLSDPLGATRALIDELVNDLVNSGISALIIKPDLFNKPTKNIGVDGFLRVVKEALNDQGDINRPEFDWGDSSGGVLFLIAGPSFVELSALAETLTILFGPAWTDLIDFVKSAPIITPHVNYEVSGAVTGIPVGADGRVQFIDDTQNHLPTVPGFDPYRGQQITMFTGRNVGITKRVESYDSNGRVFTLKPGFRYTLEVGDSYALSYITQSRDPDWNTLRMVDIIPPVSAVAEVLAAARDALPVVGPASTMARLIALLDAKVALFTQLADNLDNLVTLLEQLTTIPAIAMLPIEPQDGGNQGFVQEAFIADNAPILGQSDLTMGVVLYGGSGVFDTLKKIFPI